MLLPGHLAMAAAQVRCPLSAFSLRQAASERRARTGPRTPPETAAGKSPEERDAPEGAGGAAEEVEPERTQAAEEEEREDRRELLEAIENPSAAELVELGELAFDSGDSHAAYRYYLEVIEDSPDDPMAPFALYKLAWAEFNLGDTQAAIDDMSLVGEWLASGDAQLAEILAAAVPEDLGRFETRAESEAAGGSEL